MTEPVTKYEFRKPRIHVERGQPHLDVQLWEDGKYLGYIDLHTHKVSDGSLSVGITVRHPTRKRPA